jgi:subtilisin family serine protease
MLRREVYNHKNAPEDSFLKTRFRVKFKPSFQKSLPEVLTKFKGKQIFQNPNKKHSDWGFDLWYEFASDTEEDILKIIDELNNMDEVEIAEPIYKIQMFIQVNDPLFKDQWHYNKISLSKAWEIEMGNPNVIVAIIDGGVYIDHPDLKDNLWENLGYNFANNTTEFFPGNHGTHVAGTVSASTNNNIGVAGIAGGNNQKGVELMLCQVFGNNRVGGFANALIYAADNGAAIAQNSWGYTVPGVYDQLVLDAIDYFNENGGGNVIKGGICVFAAGNTGKDENIYPACYEGAISVASTNWDDKVSPFSTYGNWVDVSAPGNNVFSTIGSNGYGSSSGTSMACPHVSGVMALIASYAPNKFSREEIIDIIKSTTDDHYENNSSYKGKLGTGRLNAEKALLKVKEIIEPVDPVDPVEPPVDPVDPIDPVEPPVGPIDPVEPPVDPVEPPVDPVDPPGDDKKGCFKWFGIVVLVIFFILIFL